MKPTSICEKHFSVGLEILAPLDNRITVFVTDRAPDWHKAFTEMRYIMIVNKSSSVSSTYLLI